MGYTTLHRVKNLAVATVGQWSAFKEPGAPLVSV